MSRIHTVGRQHALAAADAMQSETRKYFKLAILIINAAESCLPYSQVDGKYCCTDALGIT
jgi:hypothetical protein